MATYQGVVILETIQKRDEPDYRTYVGKGKLDEVLNLAVELEVDTIIIGNILKPRQIYAIIQEVEKRKINVAIWDRVDLILKIFQLHAHTPESKLQIQLASIKHMWPRIFGMGMELDRQGGGWGAANKGIGETNTEIMQRHLREMELKIREKINHYRKVRTQNRQARNRSGALTVGLVGYTNAGKSTLMNRLTDKQVLEKDALFATLGTTIGKMKLTKDDYSDTDGQFVHHTDILIYDTIGFIRDLPPKLIDAFASTLEESLSCDILLEVVDASDPQWLQRVEITDTILEKIGAKQKKYYIFNQIDNLTAEQQKEIKIATKKYNWIFISARSWEGIEDLKRKILEQAH